jgi:Cytochrome c7 and related cytochrome c/Class III cytochrome C family
MAQIFHPSTNTIARVSILGAVFILGGVLWLLAALNRSSYATEEGVARQQPVQFSHEHHVGGLGIDCRYCHTSVEVSAFAGMPSTATCMNCHAYIWTESPFLAPVRDSFRTGQSIVWTRVYDLPDFAYFNHSIHLHKGIGCVTCHGRVDRMPLTWKAQSLQMQWCLECHRAPERFVRPREFVFSMDWQAPEDQQTLGRRLVQEYNIAKLTTCSTCHR